MSAKIQGYINHKDNYIFYAKILHKKYKTL